MLLLGSIPSSISDSDTSEPQIDDNSISSFSNSSSLSLSSKTEIGIKNTPDFYRAEVLSKEIMGTLNVDGIKVEQIRETVRIIDKSTVEDLVSVNKKYFDYLESEFGDEGRKMIEDKKQYWKERIENTPEIVTLDLVKIGGPFNNS